MSRYAIYCLPDGAFGAQGAAWLGWDAIAGRTVPVAAERSDWVTTPRRYGFHGTLKPPFRLAAGTDPEGLARAVADLAAHTPPGRAEGLSIAVLDRFVAFRPTGVSDLGRVADACVTALDGFRAPAPPEETARRRAAGLSPAQEAMLARWGYPYVLDEFRFHLTLSGRVDAPEAVRAAAQAHFTAPAPFVLDTLALCEERDGHFHLRHRFPLSGANAASA
ncbi:MAG: DUF1045 domain-containing protein [Pseudomonadota bacterium]